MFAFGLLGPVALPGGSEATTKVPIACAGLSDLRNLGASDLDQVTNSRTGDTLNYVVIGEGQTGKLTVHGLPTTDAEVLVLFPGTSGILPDWPIQMITNSKSSPDITGDTTYKASQDGRISLCRDHYLVLFDYPGVGNTSFDATNLTGDQIADDVDAVLDDAEEVYGINTDTVSVGGWSLGTLYALKYAFLSPKADTGRSIDDVILIASKSGGNVDDVPNGNQAACITTLFNALANDDLSSKLRLRIERSLARLTFPYEDQTPYNQANNTVCTADIDYDTETVSVSVAYDCPDGSECKNDIALQVANRGVEPWRQTDGVPNGLYLQQRDFVEDWDFCYCSQPGTDYTSEDCSCARSYSSPIATANGGVCRTESPRANRPTSYDCVPLEMNGALTVINGPEDLFIQWKYGRELVRAYNRQYGAGTANYVRYRGSEGAGHSVMAQHPKWMQRQIYKALNGD